MWKMIRKDRVLSPSSSLSRRCFCLFFFLLLFQNWKFMHLSWLLYWFVIGFFVSSVFAIWCYCNLPLFCLLPCVSTAHGTGVLCRAVCVQQHNVLKYKRFGRGKKRMRECCTRSTNAQNIHHRVYMHLSICIHKLWTVAAAAAVVVGYIHI